MGKNKKNNRHGAFDGRRDDNPNMKDNVEATNLDNDSLTPDPREVVEAVPEDDVEAVDNFDAVEDGDELSDAVEDSKDKEIEELKAQVEKEKKEYLFLMAEFDNFRKRTLKEKSEIIKNAGENVFKGLLPIVDDLERALKASENATDVQSVREGVILIYNKLKKFMEQNGVKSFDEDDDTFDAERHEAISAVPVPDEDKKGKILDTIEKGYTINDKVLRHAKVVVGQ